MRLGKMYAGAMMLAGLAAAMDPGSVPPSSSESAPYSLTRKTLMSKKKWQRRKRRLALAKHSRKMNRA